MLLIIRLASSLQPSSVEPVNGHAVGPEEEETASSEDGVFPPRPDGRSVSSTVHDRERERSSRASFPASTTIPTNLRASSRHRHTDQNSTSSSKLHSQTHPSFSQRVHSNPALSSHGPTASGSDSSPPSARETFLNYFFGQNGPGPLTSSISTGERSHGHPMAGHQGIIPVGREVASVDSATTNSIAMSSGLGRMVDGYGSSAAYDMKSLGKHIEAVSPGIFLLDYATLTYVRCPWTASTRHNTRRWRQLLSEH
jgi:dynamin 1-like protein